MLSNLVMFVYSWRPRPALQVSLARLQQSVVSGLAAAPGWTIVVESRAGGREVRTESPYMVRLCESDRQLTIARAELACGEP